MGILEDRRELDAIAGHEAQDRVGQLVAGVDRERAALAVPNVRADRFVARWQELQAERRELRGWKHDEARGKVEGEMRGMAKGLEHDPQVESVLRNRTKELGIGPIGREQTVAREMERQLSQGRSQGLGLNDRRKTAWRKTSTMTTRTFRMAKALSRIYSPRTRPAIRPPPSRRCVRRWKPCRRSDAGNDDDPQGRRIFPRSDGAAGRTGYSAELGRMNQNQAMLSERLQGIEQSPLKHGPEHYARVLEQALVKTAAQQFQNESRDFQQVARERAG